MAKVPVFYSFHFNNDVMRVQQIRNIGALDGNEPATANEWEQLKRTGPAAIKNWIDNNLKYKRCLVVLIGSETAGRKWINYEIEAAWQAKKAVIGIYIHNIKCPNSGTSKKGSNPFDSFTLTDGRKLSSVVPCYDPNPFAAYKDVAENIATWISRAIQQKVA